MPKLPALKGKMEGAMKVRFAGLKVVKVMFPRHFCWSDLKTFKTVWNLMYIREAEKWVADMVLLLGVFWVVFLENRCFFRNYRNCLVLRAFLNV